jgi:hypothetical protein
MYLGNPCHYQYQAISQHQDSTEEPDRQLCCFYVTFFGHIQLSYQNSKFKIKKTTMTTMAQKIGFCHIVFEPSCGIGVTP